MFFVEDKSTFMCLFCASRSFFVYERPNVWITNKNSKVYKKKAFRQGFVEI